MRKERTKHDDLKAFADALSNNIKETVAAWAARNKIDWPCRSLPQHQWCDHAGIGGFMGHTCHVTLKATLVAGPFNFYPLEGGGLLCVDGNVVFGRYTAEQTAALRSYFISTIGKRS